MEETWKVVESHPDYDVSDLGRVRSRKFGKIRFLKPGRKVDGHLNVQLWANEMRTTRMIHVLVLQAFVGPRPKGLVSRHLNDLPEDNRLVNLTYGTQLENIKDTVANNHHRNTLKTHCPRGHEYSGDNVYMAGNRRHCRACVRINSENYRARKTQKLVSVDLHV